MDGIFIMKIEKYNSNVHFIGKINKTIYGCIAEDLVTVLEPGFFNHSELN